MKPEIGVAKQEFGNISLGPSNRKSSQSFHLSYQCSQGLVPHDRDQCTRLSSLSTTVSSSNNPSCSDLMLKSPFNFKIVSHIVMSTELC